MRNICRAVGNLLIVLSVVGALLVTLGSSSTLHLPRLDLTPFSQPLPIATWAVPAVSAAEAIEPTPTSTPAPLAEFVQSDQSRPADVRTDDKPAEASPSVSTTDAPAPPPAEASSAVATLATEAATPVPMTEESPPAPTLVPAESTSAPTPAEPTSVSTLITAFSAPAEAASVADNDQPPAAPDALADPEPQLLEYRPITRVILPRIALGADVVPAELVELDDGVGWAVPSFKAGHAQYTAGPGEAGNGILFGHVTSRSLGNVFETLYRARVGDLVELFDGDERFDYQVVEVRSVSRTDVSVLAPTETASVSLITCTGEWNVALHDYMERLVVRAELIA